MQAIVGWTWFLLMLVWLSTFFQGARTFTAKRGFRYRRVRYFGGIGAMVAFFVVVAMIPPQKDSETQCNKALRARIAAHNHNHPTDLIQTAGIQTAGMESVEQLQDVMLRHDIRLSEIGGPKLWDHSNDNPGLPKEQRAAELDRLYGKAYFEQPDSCVEFVEQYKKTHPPSWDTIRDAECLSETRAFIATHDKANPGSMILQNPTGQETLAQLADLIGNFVFKPLEDNPPECFFKYEEFRNSQTPTPPIETPGLSYTHLKGGYPACISKELLDELIQAQVDKSDAAVNRLFETGECIKTKSDVRVYLGDVHLFSGIDEVYIYNANGEKISFWTPIENVVLGTQDR